ncbi:MAG: hypothetical protein K0S30_2256 [Clostridia bacterium]|jgi:hypothetical protein|nr:hypothetical protein [Clostridia bacterium]
MMIFFFLLGKIRKNLVYMGKISGGIIRKINQSINKCKRLTF